MTSGSGPLLFGPEAVVGQADWQATAVVAQPSQPNEPGGRGEDFGKSSPVGLLVMLLFFIAVAFLVRSMTKHLKRVPASFEPAPEEPTSALPPADAPPESRAEDSKS